MALHALSEVLHLKRQRLQQRLGRINDLDDDLSRDADWLRYCPAIQDRREPGTVELRWAANMGYEWNGVNFVTMKPARVCQDVILSEVGDA